MTSKNRQFFIVTDWETDRKPNAERNGSTKKDNNENKLDFVGVLPDEVSVKIFSCLDVRSLCRSLQTCWKWHGFIEGCASLWRAQFKIYKCLVPSMPCKRRKFVFHWKTELKNVYLTEKLTRKWSAGEFSTPSSYDELPGNHIQELPTEVWGAILENELSRKKPRAIRTH